MQLCETNYHSVDANRAWMSASQLKQFLDCPARTVAEIRGEYKREETSALLVGSYVDAYFSGLLPRFAVEHPEIYTRTGTLRAEYAQADEIISYLDSDDLLRRMLGGETQRIVTGEISGVPFRGKLDSLLSSDQCEVIVQDYPEMADTLLMAPGAIVDLKVMRDLSAVWKPGAGRVSFITGWRYDTQLAVYQELVGKKLPCYIVAVTKEKQPDKELIYLPQYILDSALDAVRDLIPQFARMKSGEIEAPRCGSCAWCRQTKRITGCVDADELEGGGL